MKVQMTKNKQYENGKMDLVLIVDFLVLHYFFVIQCLKIYLINLI